MAINLLPSARDVDLIPGRGAKIPHARGQVASLSSLEPAHRN